MFSYHSLPSTILWGSFYKPGIGQLCFLLSSMDVKECKSKISGSGASYYSTLVFCIASLRAASKDHCLKKPQKELGVTSHWITCTQFALLFGVAFFPFWSFRNTVCKELLGYGWQLDNSQTIGFFKFAQLLQGCKKKKKTTLKNCFCAALIVSYLS